MCPVPSAPAVGGVGAAPAKYVTGLCKLWCYRDVRWMFMRWWDAAYDAPLEDPWP
jgi:hypothetical protein